MEGGVSLGRKDGPPRIALVSVGLGRVQRGFERFVGDIFARLGDELDLTLYRSAGGEGPRQRVPSFLRPATAVARALPLGSLAGRAEYNRDCLAFALTLWRELRRERFDLIHCIDPPMAVALERLRRLLFIESRVLFTEGTAMPPRYYARVDHLHHVAEVAYRNALAHGVPESHMTLIPPGFDDRRFTPDQKPGRADLRRRNGLAEGTFVVLVVSALNRSHKRVDHIVEEVGRLEGDVLLWLDGSVEDPTLPRLARERLGDRCRVTHVASEEVPHLYRMADVLVHGALTEAFGLALIEALSSGLMVLAHDSLHFRWLVGDADCLVDMEQKGRLAARLAELRAGGARLRPGAAARSAEARRRFGWSSLAPAYAEMYRRVAASKPSPSAVR